MRLSAAVIFILVMQIAAAAQIFSNDSATQIKIDSSKKATEKFLKKGTERVGRNGFAVNLHFVNQYVNGGKEDQRNTAGISLSGDVLTGVPYIHLFPEIKYWSYRFTEKYFDRFERSIEFKDREISFQFNTAFVSGRLSSEMIRIFAGVGPSMHIEIQSVEEEVGSVLYGETTSGVRSGIGIFAGVEWPLSIYATLIFKGSYIQTYDWDKLDRKFMTFSIGAGI
ncbi:MAG: hypothetical protein JNL74_01170 [Fibrobacteres bacterium]|nr:hypothetical protein [Fibrobacterota bacterium]